MIARFQRYVGRGPSQTHAFGARILDRVRFSMWLTRALCETFGEHMAIASDHATHARIRRGMIQRLRRKLQRAPHKLLVRCAKHSLVSSPQVS